MLGIPGGEVLGEFTEYEKAQELVNTLVSGGVTPSAVSIVGDDLALVERVTQRLGYGRAAVQFALNGSWLGLIAGLAFVVFAPDDVVTPIFAGLLIGGGAGMVVGMLMFTFAKGPKRSYRSVQQVVASQYRVVVSSSAHADALAVVASQAKEES
jgi:hypothetical protein